MKPEDGRPRIRGVIVALALAAALAGCGGGEVVEAPEVIRPIKMMEVGPAASLFEREFPGRVEATLEAQVGFEVAGRLAALPVAEGQAVRRGQLLARLDPADFEARRAAAEADLNAAQADFARFEELLEKDAVSRREYEARRRNFEVAQAQLQIVQKALNDTRLVAPFRGRVARKLVDDYQSVSAKQPVVLLQDISALEIRVSVPEADLALGDPTAPIPEVDARVEVTSFPDRSFPARLAEISTAADPVTRTFEATFAFEPESDVRVLPGMTARVRVSTDKSARQASAGYAIPSAATVVGDDGRAYVWKVDADSMQVSRAPVELGALRQDDVLVESGLVEGELVATSGVHHLREGMRVRRMAP